MQAKDINTNTKINMKNKEFCGFFLLEGEGGEERKDLSWPEAMKFKIKLFFLLQKKKCSLTKKNVTRICSKSGPAVFILGSVC